MEIIGWAKFGITMQAISALALVVLAAAMVSIAGTFRDWMKDKGKDAF